MYSDHMPTTPNRDAFLWPAQGMEGQNIVRGVAHFTVDEVAPGFPATILRAYTTSPQWARATVGVRVDCDRCGNSLLRLRKDVDITSSGRTNIVCENCGDVMVEGDGMNAVDVLKPAEVLDVVRNDGGRILAVEVRDESSGVALWFRRCERRVLGEADDVLALVDCDNGFVVTRDNVTQSPHRKMMNTSVTRLYIGSAIDDVQG